MKLNNVVDDDANENGKNFGANYTRPKGLAYENEVI